MKKEKLFNVDEVLAGSAHFEESDAYIKTENGHTLRPDLLKKSSIESDFRWNNGGKEIHEKAQTIPGFEYTKEYQDYFNRYNIDTKGPFYEEPISFEEWSNTAEDFEREAFIVKDDGGITLNDEAWQKTIEDIQFRWENGGKEMYEKLQTIPDFYKTEEYRNYRQGFAEKSAAEYFND